MSSYRGHGHLTLASLDKSFIHHQAALFKGFRLEPQPVEVLFLQAKENQNGLHRY